VQNLTNFPAKWATLWPKFHKAITQYKKQGTNTHDDAPDALTGTVEKRPDGKQGVTKLKNIFH
jgi:predicted phage terminase large subunit-like protein